MVKPAQLVVTRFEFIEFTDVLLDSFVPVLQILEVLYLGNLLTDIPVINGALVFEFTAGSILSDQLICELSQTVLPNFQRGLGLEYIFQLTGFVKLEQHRSLDFSFQFRDNFVDCSS